MNDEAYAAFMADGQPVWFLAILLHTTIMFEGEWYHIRRRGSLAALAEFDSYDKVKVRSLKEQIRRHIRRLLNISDGPVVEQSERETVVQTFRSNMWRLKWLVREWASERERDRKLAKASTPYQSIHEKLLRRELGLL